MYGWKEGKSNENRWEIVFYPLCKYSFACCVFAQTFFIFHFNVFLLLCIFIYYFPFNSLKIHFGFYRKFWALFHPQNNLTFILQFLLCVCLCMNVKEKWILEKQNNGKGKKEKPSREKWNNKIQERNIWNNFLLEKR